MDERILTVLKSIGMNQSEIVIYIDLLSHKESSVLEISKRTGLHRSNTYDSLRNLIDKGFISEVVEENKRLFTTVNPEKLKDYIIQKEREVDSIIPLLKSITQIESDNERVSIEKGVFATRECMMDILTLNQDICMHGVSKEAIDLIGEGFMEMFHKERIKRRIKLKSLLDESAKYRLNILKKMDYTESRYLPRKYFSPTSIIIAGDFALISVLKDIPTIIKIKNKDIAQAYKNYFDISWNLGKES